MQTMKPLDYEQLARAITKAGVILIESGAETYRVEDTMQRICKAYGAEVVDAYATPTLLIISFSLNGNLVHNIKRVKTQKTHLMKIDEVNSLSRQIAKQPLDLEELNRRLDEINERKPYPSWLMIAASAICTFGFTFFFNGNFFDALAVIVIAVVVKSISLILEKVQLSAFFINLVSGAVLTFLAILISNLHLCDRDVVIISSMMILVPGLAITNAIRDSVSGDLVSGLTRATEAIFIAVSIAVGSGLVMMGWGGL